MYPLKGNDECFFENVVFNKIEFLSQKLWPFKWNLAHLRDEPLFSNGGGGGGTIFQRLEHNFF